jgi:hypothetical protein
MQRKPRSPKMLTPQRSESKAIVEPQAGFVFRVAIGEHRLARSQRRGAAQVRPATKALRRAL